VHHPIQPIGGLGLGHTGLPGRMLGNIRLRHAGFTLAGAFAPTASAIRGEIAKHREIKFLSGTKKSAIGCDRRHEPFLIAV